MRYFILIQIPNKIKRVIDFFPPLEEVYSKNIKLNSE
jgi:hypothetical protein